MEHLLGPSWLSLFHLVIVDAAKPRFFSPSENRKITKLDIVGGTPIYSGGSVVSWLFYMIMTLIMIKIGIRVVSKKFLELRNTRLSTLEITWRLM